MQISHIVFADDLILFLKDDLGTLSSTGPLLKKFASMSGLVLNLEKSKVYLGGCVQNHSMVINQLGVKEGKLPVPYLGLPLLSNSVKKVNCYPIIEKIKKRLDSWKNRLLPRSGRLELIKSVLSSYTSYWAAAFILPAGLIDEIERILRNFY